MSANATARNAEPRPHRPARPPVVLALVGPTGSGKTAVSLAVAPGLRAEVVGVDSMQLYRGMDVGTAKPTAEERRRVPHHMIDIADPGKPFSVASFQRAARSATDAILARGRTPLLVGGSGLYYRALVDDLEFPPTDPAVRRAIGAGDPDDLVARLRRGDPDAADRIDPANLRRVVRALEVMELTSKRFSDFRTAWDRYESRYDLVAAGVRVEAEELEARIRARVDRMFEQGLVDEVRALLERGFRSALTAPRAIAYPETVAHLDGTITLDEAREQIVRNTRRYARRQNSWFKADPRIRWFDASDTERAAGEIRAYYEHEIARRTVGA
ncbi:MAG: tRNA (adenosine(37)-N6)-dimethylallyltransferase MiaA [Actinomycetota bacterium]